MLGCPNLRVLTSFENNQYIKSHNKVLPLTIDLIEIITSIKKSSSQTRQVIIANIVNYVTEKT